MHEPGKLDEDQVSDDNKVNHLTLASQVNQPRLPRPWELREEEELETFIKEDSQYWDYCHETYPDQYGELVQFKTLPTGKPMLFQWLPWGTKGRFEPQTSYPIVAESSVDAGEDKVQLSAAQIDVIKAVKAEYELVNPSAEPKATIEIIQNEISGEETMMGNICITPNLTSGVLLPFRHLLLADSQEVIPPLARTPPSVRLWNIPGPTPTSTPSRRVRKTYAPDSGPQLRNPVCISVSRTSGLSSDLGL
ncbi:uncharacterized protein EI90DRAFT_3123736 [Cantharellus anzutake]|uniref:uncharacterized protein n=1 Tax=Cantharellus anzutake TaxID=1750568 RepID=UPI001903DF1B|nr:uncharacterized protein EI90DRAFT_3123736 [Cantharellus anzutake]KAF8331039.1 hypothetical protein EI90DRAFT_3123736 [Cantharellus anzutake]